MEVVEVETNRGKRSIICDEFRYRVDGILKSYVVSWRYSVKDCKAGIRTDSSAQTVFMQKNQHCHEPDERKNERHQLRATAMRKATDDITQRPFKIIRRALQDQQEEQLQPNDLRSVAMAVYRRRRKTYPPLPKSQSETYEVLPKMKIQTNKFEEFLQLNHPDQGMIIFTLCATCIYTIIWEV